MEPIKKKNVSRTLKRFYVEMAVVIVVFLGVCFSISRIHAQPEQSSFAPLSDRSYIIRVVQPYIVSGSVEKIAELLSGLDYIDAYAVLEDIIADPLYLDESQKVQLIFAYVTFFANDQEKQHKILDLLTTLNPKKSVLVIALQNNYQHVLPLLLAWAGETAPEYFKHALQEMVQANDERALRLLFKQNIQIPAQLLSQAAWNAVEQKKDPSFITVLVKHGADVNYTSDKGVTLLIKAAQNNDNKMVRSLLDAGADPDKIAQDDVGTALQVAIEKGYTTIDTLLRNAGARE